MASVPRPEAERASEVIAAHRKHLQTLVAQRGAIVQIRVPERQAEMLLGE